MKKFILGLALFFVTPTFAAGLPLSTEQATPSGGLRQVFQSINDLQSLNHDLTQKEVALKFEKSFDFPSLKEIDRIDTQLTKKFEELEALQDKEGEDYEGIYVLEEQISDLKQSRQEFEETYKARRIKQKETIARLTTELEDLQEDIQRQQQLVRTNVSQTAGYFGLFLGFIILLFIVRGLIGMLIKKLAVHLADTRQEALLKINRHIFNVIITLVILGVLFSQVINLLPFIAILGTGLAFAVRDSISSFIGWFVIGSKRGYKVGDIIRVGEVFGKVYEIGPFVTVIEEMHHGQKTNRLVTFPNKVIFEKEVEHYSPFQGVIERHLDFWFSPGSDLENLEQELLKLARDKKQFTFADMNNPTMVKILEKSRPHVFTQVEPRGVKLTLGFFAELSRADKAASEITKVFVALVQKQKLGSMVSEGALYNPANDKRSAKK